MNARVLAPLLLASSLLTLAAGPALAQSSSNSGGMVLLLGVQRAGKVDWKLTKSLRDSLVKGGELLGPDNTLAAPERLCGNDECLGQLASREDATAVLGAQLRDATPGVSSSQYITVTMFDAASRNKAQEATICDKCTPPQTVAALVDLSKRLLSSAREKRNAAIAANMNANGNANASAPSSPTSGETTPAAEVTAQPAAAGTPAPAVQTLPLEAPASGSSGDFLSRWPRNRKIAAGVMAGLLVAALIPTIALFTTDGQDTSVIGCGMPASGFCKLQNKTLWAAGFGISGALALGIGITFAWPNPKPASSQPATQPSSQPAGQPLQLSLIPSPSDSGSALETK